ncbi:MAG: MvaI/BcnI family restriction endonuclease [Chitinophagaceae bacterium]
MNLKNLLKIFSERGCQKVYVKKLSPNDNSKNQIYFGESFDVLNIFPSSNVTTDEEGKRKRESFKSKLDFYWINEEGGLFIAPYAQLILYPDYPEVRFSGFLKGCRNAPSNFFTARIENRILFLGVSEQNKIYGFVTLFESEVGQEFLNLKKLDSHGVFAVITIARGQILRDSKGILLNELNRIHNLGWITSKRLNADRALIPCNHTNCGGYTLEAELNIPSNAIAGPDFLGWEIKQFNVTDFNKFGSKSITLMDHSPTGGYFHQNGAEAFVRKYGYPDRKGRPSRMNFGGTHKHEVSHKLTSLKMIIEGFDYERKKIVNTNGYVALIDDNKVPAAIWSFSSIIEHWKAKHPQACYVPSKSKKGQANQIQQYCYGNKIILGNYTDVSLLLNEIHLGNVFYDPGIKLEMAIEGERKQSVKVRSLFRTKPINLFSLYYQHEVVDTSSM